jgi:hypothetical protein
MGVKPSAGDLTGKAGVVAGVSLIQEHERCSGFAPRTATADTDY